MGYDISNHAVDTALFTERLVPAVLGQKVSIDDMLERATDLSVVASRANIRGTTCPPWAASPRKW
jgi:hypothetical protein